MIFDEISGIEIDPNLQHKYGLVSGIVWGNSIKVNGTYPIMYLTKPKHVSQHDYEAMLDSIKITFEYEEGKY